MEGDRFYLLSFAARGQRPLPRIEARIVPLAELRRPRDSGGTDERWMSEDTRLAVASAAKWCFERRGGRVLAVLTGATYMRVLGAIPHAGRDNPWGLAQSIRQMADKKTRGVRGRSSGEHVLATRVHVDYLDAEAAARFAEAMRGTSGRT